MRNRERGRWIQRERERERERESEREGERGREEGSGFRVPGLQVFATFLNGV